MSDFVRRQLERKQVELGVVPEVAKVDGGVAEEQVAEEKKPKKKGRKATLTPDKAPNIVKSVSVSEDSNEIKLLLAVNPTETPTAQQKGAYIGKHDGKIHFFTKSHIAKAEKTLCKALAPYKDTSSGWGRVPIEVKCTFFFPYASSTPKRELHKIGPMLERPDVDNITKLYLDCLTQSGYWADDSLVNSLILRKRRTTGPACITITITNLKPKFEALFRDTENHDSPTLFTPPASQAKPAETNPLQDLFDAANSRKDN